MHSISNSHLTLADTFKARRRLPGITLGILGLLLLAMLTSVVRAADSNLDLPGDSQLRELVGRTLLAFDAAVKSKDFTDFRRLTSSALSEQMSADDLRASFHNFIDRHADLSGIAGVAPVWDMPPSLREGVLRLRGRYPTAPMQVLFSIKYVDEAGDWKIQGIDVKLKRPETQPSAEPTTRPTSVPTGSPMIAPTEANRLVRDTLLLFNDCVRANDFKPLYDAASATFRAQVPANKLQGAFKQFTKKQIDLSSVAHLEPQEDEPPHVDAQQVLIVRGKYATTPTVLFQARYIQEAGNWKLLGLSVRTEEPGTQPVP